VLPERLRQVRFSRPYYVYRLQLVVRKDDTRFASLNDLAKRKDVEVGTMEGTAAERVLDSMGVRKRIYDGQTELYKELSNKRIDTVYIDTIINAQSLPRFPDLHAVGPAEHQGYYAIVFRKDDAELAGAFDLALARLIDDGALRRVYEKWNIWNNDQKEWPPFRRYAPAEAAAADEWPFRRYWPYLRHGALVTVFITVMSMCLAVALGLPI